MRAVPWKGFIEWSGRVGTGQDWCSGKLRVWEGRGRHISYASGSKFRRSVMDVLLRHYSLLLSGYSSYSSCSSILGARQ